MADTTTPDVGTRVLITLPHMANQVAAYDLDGDFSRELLETTNFGTAALLAGEFGGRTFVAADFGAPMEITFTCDFDPDNFSEVLTGAADTCTVVWPQGAQISGNAFVTDFNPSFAVNELMTATLTVRFSGPVTFTAAP